MSPSHGIVRDKVSREREREIDSSSLGKHLCSVTRLECDCVIIHELIFPLRDLGFGPFVSISKWIAGHNARNGNASDMGCGSRGDGRGRRARIGKG